MAKQQLLAVGLGLSVAMSVKAAPDAARRAEADAQGAALVEQLTPQERLEQLMMDAPGVERLGIKPYHWWNEALHGIAREGLATVFPQSMAAAASFDAKLQRKIGDIVSTEARAKYNLYRAKGDYGIYRGLTVWSPNVNMFRDPRWGRGQETFGEDPFLAGAMGSAYVRGLQGSDRKYLKTAACAKHFAVHSGPERLRHGFSANISERDLNEYYLPAFKTLVTEARVESVMGAYSAINGKPCCSNAELLTGILRGRWRFAGHVVSDVGAVNDIFAGHHAVASQAEASKAAMAAGLDLCSEETYKSLTNEVASGAVTPDQLAVPLRRLYRTRALLGQFDPEGSTPWDGLGAESVATKAHRKVALEMAEKSLVLVSNKNGALPFAPKPTSGISVVGPLAKSEVALLGNYCGFSDAPSTVLSGFVGEAGAGLRVTDEEENRACDLVVVCVGITAADEGEEGCSLNNASGDRESYGIPESHLKVLQDNRRRHPAARIVAVVFGCSPFDLKPVVDCCDAVLLAWYPGEQGGRAIARTVFGRNNPSGRLPITYPKSYDDLPDFADYSLQGRTYLYPTKEPLYPFGYGLSYTTFAYGAAKGGRTKGGKVIVSVAVTNTGKVAGEEVVQAYVRAPAAAKDRRIHHLAGFARVALAPGETKTVEIALPKAVFMVFDEQGGAFVPKGESTVFVGGGQPGFAPTLSVPIVF